MNVTLIADDWTPTRVTRIQNAPSTVPPIQMRSRVIRIGEVIVAQIDENIREYGAVYKLRLTALGGPLPIDKFASFAEAEATLAKLLRVPS